VDSVGLKLYIRVGHQHPGNLSRNSLKSCIYSAPIPRIVWSMYEGDGERLLRDTWLVGSVFDNNDVVWRDG
jgi:hypothetical protein